MSYDQPSSAGPHFSDFTFTRPSKVSERKRDSVNPDGTPQYDDGHMFPGDDGGILGLERVQLWEAIEKLKKDVIFQQEYKTILRESDSTSQVKIEEATRELEKLEEELEYKIMYLKHFDKKHNRTPITHNGKPFTFSRPSSVSTRRDKDEEQTPKFNFTVP